MLLALHLDKAAAIPGLGMGLVVKGPDRVAEVLHADDLAAILGQRAIALDAAFIGQLVALADGERRILGDGQRHAVLHSHIAGQLRVADDRAVLAVEAHAVLDVLAVGFITGSLDPGAFHGHVAARQNAVAVFRRIGLDNAVLDLNIIVSAVNTDVCFRLCFRSAAVDRDLFFCPDRRVIAARLHLGTVRDANRASCVNAVAALAIRRDGTAVNRQTVVRINRRVKAGSLHFSAVRDGDRAACVNAVAALALRRDGAAGNLQRTNHTKRHIRSRRLDLRVVLDKDIARSNDTVTRILAIRGPSLRFEIAVALQRQITVEDFQTAHRRIRCLIGILVQAVELGVVLESHGVRRVVGFHTHFKRRIVILADVSDRRIAG